MFVSKRPSAPWVLIASLVALVGCANRAENQPPRQVRVVRVAAGAPEAPARFAGEVTARRESELSFRVAGKLVSRRVEVGERIRKGQVLAQLDPSDYRLAVENLRAQLAASRAEREFAREDLARYGELSAQNFISQPELDRRRTIFRSAAEKTAALQAQWEQARHQLAYTDLIADRDGVVTAVKAEAGQVVAVGQTVARLAQLDEKEVSIQIPEHRLAEVEVGQRVEASLWADGERRFLGRIREIAPAADPASRTYSVRVTLLEGQESAQLGMTATVWLRQDGAPIVIPLSSVFTLPSDPGQPRIWRVDELRRTVGSVPVRLGELAGGDRIAVAGVAEGELIVSAGVHRLQESEAVRFQADAASGKLASLGGQP